MITSYRSAVVVALKKEEKKVWFEVLMHPSTGIMWSLRLKSQPIISDTQTGAMLSMSCMLDDVVFNPAEITNLWLPVPQLHRNLRLSGRAKHWLYTGNKVHFWYLRYHKPLPRASDSGPNVTESPVENVKV